MYFKGRHRAGAQRSASTNLLRKYLEKLLKYRFWFGRPGVKPRMAFLIRHADTSGPWSTLTAVELLKL